jgi:glycine cleavage system T protein (aminomethyltransferase)
VTGPVRTTCLRAEHERLGARLTDFAGWEMPIQYAGVRAEHEAVRTGAGLFDLCHMGRLRIAGADALKLLSAVTPSSFADLKPGQARYTVLINEGGGIVDDIIVTRAAGDSWDVCVNASRREADLGYLRAAAAGAMVAVEDMSERLAQIAVQGPDTPKAVRGLLAGPFPRFMHAVRGAWRGVPLVVSRTGYSGELGVEIFLAAEAAPGLWRDLLGAAVPCGLGARDTLRLEMGYPLYGAELTEATDPVEAGIGWVVDFARPDLPAAERLKRSRDAPRRRLTGLVLDGPGVPRGHCPVLHAGAKIGETTSGNMALSVGRGVALAYLPPDLAAEGTAVAVDVRGRVLDARVSRPPFWRKGTVRAAVQEAGAG